MENENMIIEEAVVAEGEEIIIEEAPVDAVDVVVEDEGDASAEPVEEVVGEAADEETEEAEEAEESAGEMLARKCQEVKEACCNTIDRIICDLKATDYNPYIKQTRITRVEIFRNGEDEEPIDTFETTDVKSYSAKALLVATAAAALVVATSGSLIRRVLK
ncbi:MAG: hypothetical protein IJD75_07335 [Clostridia bacterium]|nr:hypothetical protein [Clostridia bacterium]